MVEVINLKTKITTNRIILTKKTPGIGIQHTLQQLERQQLEELGIHEES